jgi:hypothetical protein
MTGILLSVEYSHVSVEYIIMVGGVIIAAMVVATIYSDTLRRAG